jgi:HEPN domain-containing protein
VKPETQNWLDSADYDVESAHSMLSSGRYLYVVFLCHLALEKTLKALVVELTNKQAPRSHDLIYLLKLTGLIPEQNRLDFISMINNASILTRYPANIRDAIKDYPFKVASEYLKQTEEVISWLKSQPSLKK